MLLKLRGGLNNFLVTILLGLLIAAFAIWGIGPGMLSGSNQYVAKVGDTEVSTNRFFNLVQQRAQSLQIQFGGEFSTPQLVQMMQLDQQVLGQMIVDATVKEHISSLGLRATDDQLAAELRNIEAFKMPGGGFSPELMQQALISNNITQSELFSDLRSAVTRGQLVESFVVEDMISRDMANALYTWQAERRGAALVNLPADIFVDVQTPTEEELATYYETGKSAYMTPERRTYDYMLLTPAYFASQVEVPEGEIERIYEARSEEFAASEIRAVYQVSFDSEQEARDFIAAVSGGADFTETAVASSDFEANEIDLGDNTRADMEAEFGPEAADLVFSLPENSPSEPVEDIAGWSVYMVPSVTVIEGRPFEAVADELEQEYRAEEAIDIMFDYQNSIDEAMESTGSLTEIAQNVGLPLASVVDIDAQGRGVDGNPAVTQQNEYIVQSAVFREEFGAEPTITDLNPTDSTAGFYLFEIKEIKTPVEQPLGDIRERVIADWTAERQREKAGEVAETAVERLKAGETPEAIAQDLGGTSFEAKNVARSGDNSSNLAPNIRQLIFDLDVDDVDSAAAADGNGYIVVKLLSKQAGDPESAEAAVNSLLDQLNADFQEELFVQYQAYLTERYPAEINSLLIQQLFSPENFQQ